MRIPHEKFNNPPVIHVLAVVRLNPVEEIAEYIDRITLSLRSLGYLDRIDSEDHNLNINLQELCTAEDGTVSPKLDVIKLKAWVFIHRGKEMSITISKDKVAFQCSNYQDFATFEKQFASAFRAVVNEIGNNYVETRRLGLRYVNLMVLDQDRPPSFWVRSELLGAELGSIEHPHQHSKIERLYSVPPGVLAIRYSDLAGQPPLPVGINPMGLNIPRAVVDVLENDRRFALLDLDRSNPEVEDFNLETILERLQAFNHSLQEIFNACTTMEAKNVWREEP